jgi:hypothetical protein
MTDKSIDLENRTKITTGEKTIFEILEVLWKSICQFNLSHKYPDTLNIYESFLRLKLSLYRPWGFQQFEALTFLDNQQMNVVMTALWSGCFIHQRTYHVLNSVRDWVNSSVIVRPERICQWEISITPSGNEPDLLSSSAVPQPAAPPRFSSETDNSAAQTRYILSTLLPSNSLHTPPTITCPHII